MGKRLLKLRTTILHGKTPSRSELEVFHNISEFKKVYKVKEELFDEGIIGTRSPSGNILRTYNQERTICDLIRSRRNIEAQELQTAIKEYVRLKDKNVPLLMRYAKAFSVEKIIRQYLEVLL